MKQSLIKANEHAKKSRRLLINLKRNRARMTLSARAKILKAASAHTCIAIGIHLYIFDINKNGVIVKDGGTL